jgi:hypothetical protein
MGAMVLRQRTRRRSKHALQHPEELEEALGLPIGWTDVGLSDEQRMRILLSREPPPISFEGLRQKYDFD